MNSVPSHIHQRPEELKKLEYARSLQHIDFEKRAEMMHEAFLKKYGTISMPYTKGTL